MYQFKMTFRKLTDRRRGVILLSLLSHHFNKTHVYDYIIYFPRTQADDYTKYTHRDVMLYKFNAIGPDDILSQPNSDTVVTSKTTYWVVKKLVMQCVCYRKYSLQVLEKNMYKI